MVSSAGNSNIAYLNETKSSIWAWVGRLKMVIWVLYMAISGDTGLMERREKSNQNKKNLIHQIKTKPVAEGHLVSAWMWPMWPNGIYHHAIRCPILCSRRKLSASSTSGVLTYFLGFLLNIAFLCFISPWWWHRFVDWARGFCSYLRRSHLYSNHLQQASFTAKQGH